MKTFSLLNDSIERNVLIGFISAFVITFLGCALVYYNTTYFLETNQLVQHTHQIVAETDSAMSMIMDAESASRGYVITGEDKFLEGYQKSFGNIKAQFEKVRQLTADNPKQQKLLAEIIPIVDEKLKFTESSIELRRTNDFVSAQKHISSGKGKIAMDRIRVIIEEIKQEEVNLLQQRTENNYMSESRALSAFFGLSFVVLIFTLIGYLVIRRDIDRRKLAEAKQIQLLADFEASETRYRKLIDESLGLICTHDLDGKVISLNPAAAKSLGYSQEEVVGQNLRAIIDPQRQVYLDKYLENISKYGEASGVLLVNTKKGEERIWRYNNVLCKEEYTPAYILGYAQDITDIMRTEEMLRESKRFAESIAEYSTSMIYLLDLDTGRTVYSNRNVTDFLGYSREQINEMGDAYHRTVVHPEDLPETANYRQIIKDFKDG